MGHVADVALAVFSMWMFDSESWDSFWKKCGLAG